MNYVIIIRDSWFNYNVQAKSLVLSGLYIKTNHSSRSRSTSARPSNSSAWANSEAFAHVVKLHMRIAHFWEATLLVDSRIGIQCITLWHRQCRYSTTPPPPAAPDPLDAPSCLCTIISFRFDLRHVQQCTTSRAVKQVGVGVLRHIKTGSAIRTRKEHV